jgi:hypothetical protein
MLAALTDLSMVSYIHHLYAVLAESENMHLWPSPGEGERCKRMAE